MLERLAALLPSQTRRSEESQARQQFSTPLPLAGVVAVAAALTPADRVLEPSAGTGLLAVFAELAGASLVLNELAGTRAGLLERLFPGVPVTRHDAAAIHDHLDPAVRPTVVLMNPPFSALAAVDGRVADAALRHLASALARLAEGGRLVAVTGAGLAPDHPAWRDAFAGLQERGRVVFSAAIDGRVYARHGTTVDTRLTVIDRVPADDPTVFPASPGMAPDVATLLDWVRRDVPSRAPVLASATAPLPVLARTAPARPAHRVVAVPTVCAPASDPAARRTGLRAARLGAGGGRPAHRRALRTLRAPVHHHPRRPAAPDAAGPVRRHGRGRPAQAPLPPAFARRPGHRRHPLRCPAGKRHPRRARRTPVISPAAGRWTRPSTSSRRHRRTPRMRCASAVAGSSATAPAPARAGRSPASCSTTG